MDGLTQLLESRCSYKLYYAKQTKNKNKKKTTQEASFIWNMYNFVYNKFCVKGKLGDSERKWNHAKTTGVLSVPRAK